MGSSVARWRCSRGQWSASERWPELAVLIECWRAGVRALKWVSMEIKMQTEMLVFVA